MVEGDGGPNSSKGLWTCQEHTSVFVEVVGGDMSDRTGGSWAVRQGSIAPTTATRGHAKILQNCEKKKLLHTGNCPLDVMAVLLESSGRKLEKYS